MEFFSTDVRHVNVQKTYQQVNKVKKNKKTISPFTTDKTY